MPTKKTKSAAGSNGSASVPVATEKKSVVPLETEDGVMRVVEVKKLTAFELQVTVESTDLERLTSPESRKLAFEQRLNHGMADAGVEARAGTFISDEEYAAAKAAGRNVERWRREFRMVNML